MSLTLRALFDPKNLLKSYDRVSHRGSMILCDRSNELIAREIIEGHKRFELLYWWRTETPLKIGHKLRALVAKLFCHHTLREIGGLSRSLKIVAEMLKFSGVCHFSSESCTGFRCG